MDREQLLELVPHYVALVIVLLVALTALRLLVGEVALWAELLVAFVVAVAYRPVVRRLGYAPSAWER